MMPRTRPFLTLAFAPVRAHCASSAALQDRAIGISRFPTQCPWRQEPTRALIVFLERQRDLFLSPVTLQIEPAVCHEEFLTVPLQATNLTVVLNLPGDGTVTARLERANETATNVLVWTLTGPTNDLSLIKDQLTATRH